MPGLVGDAAAGTDRFGIGQEEAEVVHAIFKPLAQVGEPAPGFILPGLQRQPGAGGQAVRVIDVEIGAPVVAAGAGQGAPVQDGVEALLVAQLQGVDGLAVGIEQRCSPRHLPFQMASWRSKPRQLEAGCRLKPAWAAATCMSLKAAAVA